MGLRYALGHRDRELPSQRGERKKAQTAFSFQFQVTKHHQTISQGPDAKNCLRHHSQHSQTTLPHDAIILQKRLTQQILLTPLVSFQVSRKAFESPELTKVRSLILKPTVAIPNWS